MKTDINSREDIVILISSFYDKLLDDPQISHFFQHILSENHLDHHLEIIVDFWEDILLDTMKYGKNAIKPHMDLQNRLPFEKQHFTIWISHFNNTIDTYFEGTKANLAKTRALSIATVMQIKLVNKTN